MADANKTCFIAMPVRTTAAHAELFGDEQHWEHVMETLFVPAVKAAGFVPWRPVARGSHLIHAEIVRQLEQADMVLCDMSQANPNVFFELGVRTSVNKPVALVRCDAKESIPFDVSGINTHTYDPSLKAWSNEAEVEALAEHIRQAEGSCAGENPMWKQFGMVLKAQEPTAGGSKEEAMLSVLSQQIDHLTAKVNTVSPGRPVYPSHEESGSEFPPPSDPMSLDDVMSMISHIAEDADQAVRIEFDPNNGFSITQMDPLNASSQRFRQTLRRELAPYGFPVHFESAAKNLGTPNIPS